MTARPNSPVLRFSLLLGLAAALAMSGCSGGKPAEAGKAAEQGKDEKKAEAVPVEVAAVAKRTIAASYTGTANLDAPAEAKVVAKTSGVVLQILAEEGQVVKAGQLLARIDPDRPRLEMERARATVRKLENNYRRSQELLAQKLVSAEASDQIRYDLESARASFELAQLELSYTNIVAPISGVIAERMVKPGNLLGLNAPVFRIVDNSRLEAVLNVPERELAIMKSGLSVRMQVDAVPGRSFEGRIDRVSPVVESGSGTFRVVCAFDSEGALRPGMFGRLEIVYDQRQDALTLPRSALLEGEGEPAVFVVRDGKAQRTPVQLGYVNGTYAEVRGGVAEGDQVVTVGKVTLRDGVSVDVVNLPKDEGQGSAQVAQTAAN